MARTIELAFAGVPRVDLMPRSQVERRERESLTGRWVWGVLGAILLAGAIIAGAFALNVIAAQRMVAEQATTNRLLTELSALSEVSQALAAEQDLVDFRSQAMGADFAWQPVLATTAQALPVQVVLTGFELTAGALPQGDDPAAETGITGSLTFDSPTPIDIVATIRNVRAMPGVLAADGQEVTTSTVSDGLYQYRLTVTFDQSVYSNTYAAEEGDE